MDFKLAGQTKRVVDVKFASHDVDHSRVSIKGTIASGFAFGCLNHTVGAFANSIRKPISEVIDYPFLMIDEGSLAFFYNYSMIRFPLYSFFNCSSYPLI